MLEDILKSKKCFKLVCAAGNEDAFEVEKLVALYSKAGCKFFDLCAKPEVVIAAKKGLAKNSNGEGYLCVSVGTKGDPHVRKAQIGDKCVQCNKCISICPQNAINTKLQIDQSRCIGCAKCAQVCEYDAINFIDKSKDLKEILPPLIDLGIDCIELHSKLTENEKEIFEKWDYINRNFDGILSICINSSESNSDKLIKILRKMLSVRNPYTTIIKSEGDSMTGTTDDFDTTIQTIKIAKLLEKESLPAHIMLSGGTNIKSTKIAREMNTPIDGVAIGTYARNLVKEYTNREDFLTDPEVFNKALTKAKELVDYSIKYL